MHLRMARHVAILATLSVVLGGPAVVAMSRTDAGSTAEIAPTTRAQLVHGQDPSAVPHAVLGSIRVSQRPADPLKRAALNRVPTSLPKLSRESGWAIPPMIEARARHRDHAGNVRHLERLVLRSPMLLLAPKARRSIRLGSVDRSALLLLTRVPRLGAPLLVFAATGHKLRIQATTAAMTQRLLSALGTLPAMQQPAHLRLRPMGDQSLDQPAPRGGMLGAQAASIAQRYLGIPYVWGGSDPRIGLDCSGFTMIVYRQLGIRLDHYAAFQFLEGRRIAPADLEPGDLVFFEPKPDGPGHEGIYLGNGLFIHAPHTGDVVKISTLESYAYSYMGATRPY
jgi:hypothetical protein